MIIMILYTAIGSIKITQQDVVRNLSERAEFNCSVCPELTPMFMWNFTQRGTHKMEIITNRSQTLILTGPAGSQTLIINNTQWRDVGVYKCIASIDGTIIETETSLDVLSKPLF